MSQDMIFVIGGPGSGKGTQCELYAKMHPEYKHISTGDLVRNLLKDSSDSEHSLRIKKCITEGQLLPQEEILEILTDEIKKYPDAKGFLIDGYPRTIEQLNLFKKQYSTYFRALYFDTTEFIMTQRVLSRNEGRADDNIDTVKKRLTSYNRDTLPLIKELQDQNKIFYLNASLTKEQMTHQFNNIIANKGIVDVSLFEFMKLYIGCGNFYDAVTELEKQHLANNFHVSLFNMSMFYVLQSRSLVKPVLAANTITGPQYRNFDAAQGHSSIAGIQAFLGAESNERNPMWRFLHTGIAESIGDKKLIESLVAKHMPAMFTQHEFVLDEAFENFMVGFWGEFLFGNKIGIKEYAEIRVKLLDALRYTFYDSRLKALSYIGEKASQLYRYLKNGEFADINAQLKDFAERSEGGLFYRLKNKLRDNPDFPQDKLEETMLSNIPALILEGDFLHWAMDATIRNIVKSNITESKDRRDAYHQSLRESYLFKFRDRITQAEVKLDDVTLAKGSRVFLNLVQSGLYHSSGPRGCVGIQLTGWIKEAIFSHWDNKVLKLVSTGPAIGKEALIYSRDVPVPNERLVVKWKYRRDYLQSMLPHYPFKGVNAFYDVLKIFENPHLTKYIAGVFLRKISRLNLDNLCIVTPEVRGIPIAAIVAGSLNVPLVVIRKEGKIPGETYKSDYASAYAADVLEISTSSECKGKNVILIDDGLASGGSAVACAKLIEQVGGEVQLVLTIINHLYAESKRDPEKLSKYRVRTLFDFEAPVKDSGKAEVDVKLTAAPTI